MLISKQQFYYFSKSQASNQMANNFLTIVSVQKHLKNIFILFNPSFCFSIFLSDFINSTRPKGNCIYEHLLTGIKYLFDQVLTLERLRESVNKCFAKYNYNYFIFQPPICQNCKHNPQGEAGRI